MTPGLYRSDLATPEIVVTVVRSERHLWNHKWVCLVLWADGVTTETTLDDRTWTRIL